MINWDTVKFDVGRAKRDFNSLSVNASSITPIEPRSDFIAIREELIAARDEIFERNNLDYANKLDYQFDVLFGLKLFRILNEKSGFTNRAATNDEVWRYLSVCVVPDIVHSRWGLNADHFFQQSRRIWLKAIWWYVHLSWMGNEEDTYRIIKDNSTDTVLQLVERPGIGYNVLLYREIMAQYAEHEDTSRELFRRVLKLNTARLLTTSPELVEGGIKQYVLDLFDTVEGNDETSHR